MTDLLTTAAPKRGRYRTRLDAERYRPITRIIRQHKLVDAQSLQLVLQVLQDGDKKARVMPSKVRDFAERMSLAVEGDFIVAGSGGAAAQNLINNVNSDHESAVCFLHLIYALGYKREVEAIESLHQQGKKAADLHVWEDDRRIAVEVELTQKDADRYSRIADSYMRQLDAGVVQGVRYLVSGPGISRAVSKAMPDPRVSVNALKGHVISQLGGLGLPVSENQWLGV